MNIAFKISRCSHIIRHSLSLGPLCLSKLNVIMSKKVCICGKDSNKTKPLVITITTCKNKHPGLTDNSKSYPPEHSSPPGGSDKSHSRPSTAKGSSSHLFSNSMNSTENASFYDTTDSPTANSTPSRKSQDNSRSAFKKMSATKLDNRQLSFSNKDEAHDIPVSEDNEQETSEGEEGEDSEKPAIELLEIDDDVELHVHQSDDDNPNTKNGNTISKSTDTQMQVSFPENVFSDTGPRQLTRREHLYNPLIAMKPRRSVLVQAIGQTKDKVFNFPSDIALKLPILTSRYHGPGCAMEINVMEKHSKNCKYHKLKNPDRNPADDRVGSYEVIGRITYKTCQVGTFNMSDHTEKKNTAISQFELGKLYSLLNLPINSRQKTVSSSRGRQVESLNDLLNGLVKSSKSSPADLEKRYSLAKVDKSTSKVDTYWLNSKRGGEEEIYFTGKKCDKSVQEPQTKHNNWYKYLFPCIFMKKSGTSML